MSRVSEIINYLNCDVHPTARQLQFQYSDITITKELKSDRRKYRYKIKKAQVIDKPSKVVDD